MALAVDARRSPPPADESTRRDGPLSRIRTVRAEVKRFALDLPGAWEDHPWGEDVAKVGKKVFAFLSAEESERLRMTLKLPTSGDEALSMPFAKPAGYGLDRGGWVDIECAADDLPPPEVLIAWVEESYRAVASRRLIAELEAARSG
jgi:predicted DNA-binding protein (MmcQ/YjbR family)